MNIHKNIAPHTREYWFFSIISCFQIFLIFITFKLSEVIELHPLMVWNLTNFIKNILVFLIIHIFESLLFQLLNRQAIKFVEGGSFILLAEIISKNHVVILIVKVSVQNKLFQSKKEILAMNTFSFLHIRVCKENQDAYSLDMSIKRTWTSVIWKLFQQLRFS